MIRSEIHNKINFICPRDLTLNIYLEGKSDSRDPPLTDVVVNQEILCSMIMPEVNILCVEESELIAEVMCLRNVIISFYGEEKKLLKRILK